MTKKGIIAFDLTSFTGIVPGGLTLQLGRRLPRDDKAALERHLAGIVVASVAEFENKQVSGLRSNLPDPPDVAVNLAGQEVGIELTELLPPNRLEKDGITASIRREILAELQLGPNTRNRVFQVFFRDDYATDFRPGRVGTPIGRLLNSFCQGVSNDSGKILIPENLRDAITSISYTREDLSVDPRLSQSDEPLLIFGTQATLLTPEDDCPEIVRTILDRKCVQSVDRPTWLVLWSEHYAIDSILDELEAAIIDYLRQRSHPYQRVFHLHLGAEKRLREIRGQGGCPHPPLD